MQPDLSGAGDADPEIARQLRHRKIVRDDGLQFPVFQLFDLACFEPCGFLGAFLEITLILRVLIQSVENFSGPIRARIGPGNRDDLDS